MRQQKLGYSPQEILSGMSQQHQIYCQLIKLTFVINPGWEWSRRKKERKETLFMALELFMLWSTVDYGLPIPESYKQQKTA